MSLNFSDEPRFIQRRRWNFTKNPKFKTRANKNWMDADKVDVEVVIKKMLSAMKEPE